MSTVKNVSYVGTSLAGLTQDVDASVNCRDNGCFDCSLKTIEDEDNSLYVEFSSEAPLLNTKAPALKGEDWIETYIVEDESYSGDSDAISKYYFKLELNQSPESGEWEIVIDNRIEDENQKEHRYTLRKA